MILVVALLAGASFLQAGGEMPEDTGGIWDHNTPLAQATPSDVCPLGFECAEWCVRYQGGTAVGSGMLCCVDPNRVSEGLEACSQLLGGGRD